MLKEIKKRVTLKLLLIVMLPLISVPGLYSAVSPRKIESYGVSYKLLELINRDVAVIPFRNISGITQATNAITDKFTIFLVKSNLFNVIERERLDELFREQEKYGLSGRFDDATMAQAGRILGAAAIFVGTIYKYEPYVPGFFLFARPPVVRIGIRLINSETGETLWSAEEEFNGFDKSVQKLVNRQDRWRVRSDVDFLATILCRELVNTLLDTYKKQLELQEIKVEETTSASVKEDASVQKGPHKIQTPIIFEAQSAELIKKSLEVIKKIASEINKQKPQKVVVEGFADKDEGDFQYTIELSKKRAATVKEVLEEYVEGIPIITIGYGSEYAEKTDSLIEKQLNRRVDIILLY